MGVLPSDILIKSAIEAAISDLRKNNWILDDVFGDLAQDSLANIDYGYKEVQQAKEWFMSNDIAVYQYNRIDTPRLPCITVVQTNSREMQERDALGDEGEDSEIEPRAITKRIQKVIGNFTPKAYESTEGLITLPKGLDTYQVSAGMFLVSSKTSKAYVIKEIRGEDAFTIAAGTREDFHNCYIAPATSLWNLKKELTFLREDFDIGVHAQSDLNQVIWMRQLIIYILLRYKEAYLERRGFELSTFNVGTIQQNPHFQGTELVWSCPIRLSGDVEANFIKYAAPKLAKTSGGVRIMDGPKTPDQYRYEVSKQGWDMVKDHEEEATAETEPTKDEEE